MRRLAVLVALVALTGCPAPPAKPPRTSADTGATSSDSEAERRARLVAELQDDILASYERDDPPDVETTMIDPRVGPMRIGAGPGDVLYGDDVKLRASSRWPLFVTPGTQTEVRSKRLDIHLSADERVAAAWTSDEVSWRIVLCGRTAAIPLRITALYARDGDRWVQVVEHLSFGRIPRPYPELRGLRIKDAFVTPKLAEYPRGEIGGPLSTLLSGNVAMIRNVVALDPMRKAEGDPTQPAPTFLLAPDPDSEWHGDDDVSRAQIVDGPIAPEDRRVGTIGPTVAYWVGNFVYDLPARPGTPGGRVRLRGTFVFEKRAGKWLVVQGHVSEPIDDIDELGEGLAQRVFGSSLLSDKPLRLDCDDGAKAPVAAP